ncbi:MAG: AAA family ATPase, partial [Isosphaeraceae bacterium]
MPAAQVRKSGNVLADIAGWSEELPAWQQDGLRRIIEGSPLSPQDIDELTQLCKKELGASEGQLTPRPLNPDTIPKGSVTAQAVTLRSIAEAEHVNAIDGDQELTFGESGLTLIFGYNASGKSGYGRILRRACRSREKGTAILPNVLEATAAGPAAAVITYALDGIEQQPAQWIDEQRAVQPLGSVSFFDSQCAAIHVREKNGIAFTPFGLDVLPKLGTVCKDVQTRLDNERKLLENIRPRFLQSSIATGDSAVGKLLKTLNHETSIERLEALASLTEGDRQRIEALTVLLVNDGRKHGEELRNRARRLLALKETLAKALAALSTTSLESLKLLAADYRTKAMAAEAAAKISFSNDPLSGIGEPVWRELWEAARRYSAQAYPNRQFPVVDGDNAVCVLCQQPLTEDGKDRLSRFETFVADDTAKTAARAKAALNEAVEQLELLGLREKTLKEQLADLGLVSREALTNARTVLATLIRQCRAIKHAHHSGNWELIREIRTADITFAMQQLIDGLIAQAGEVERAVDDGERQKLASELGELKARDWLASVLGDMKEHITRLHDVHKLKNCIDSTKTTTITAKSKALAKEHVTDQLRNAFASEIQHMRQGVKRLNVELNAVAGEYGSSYYRIQLVGARNAKIEGIVSEGEHKCIALAGFLAELATEASKSAVVFDDPVTSLDHLWRQCFAQRLAEEAIHRQVIVFTHDIVFLHDLITFAERQNVPATIRRIQAGHPQCGYVSDGLPWIAQKTRQRIDALEKAARATRTDFDAQNDDKYARDICSVYSDLRATVEPVVPPSA